MTIGSIQKGAQRLRHWLLIGMLVMPIAPSFSGEKVENVIGRDQLIQFLTPISGDEPRAVDLRVPFKLGSSTLTPVAREQLDELVGALSSKRLKGLKVDILGHTDALGSQVSNQKLSERRTSAVVEYLVAKAGLDRSLLRAEGLGETQLRPDLDPLDPAQRRVEVIVYPAEEKARDPSESATGHSPIN
ncbi:MAG: OmpA family protein [Alphaproteobacteria bacterium]|nr:OmpA family protein [Alphaproteobacteria bacterium]